MAKEVKKTATQHRTAANAKTTQTHSKKETAKEKESRLQKEQEQKERRIQEVTRRKEITDDVALIVTLMICIILYLSYFGICGKVGSAINVVVFGLLGGYLPYIFPIALFFLVVFMRANPGNPLATRKSTFFIFALFFLASLIHIISGCARKYGIFQAFAQGYKQKVGGGIFGAILGKPMYLLFGKVASVIILAALILVCVILITERSMTAYYKRRRREKRQAEEEYFEYETERRRTEREISSMTLDEIQEENRKRRLVLVDAAPAKTGPDYDFYEQPKSKKPKKKSFLDRLKENGGKQPEVETPTQDMHEIRRPAADPKDTEAVPASKAEYPAEHPMDKPTQTSHRTPTADDLFSDITITKNGSYEEDSLDTSEPAHDYGRKPVVSVAATAESAPVETKTESPAHKGSSAALESSGKEQTPITEADEQAILEHTKALTTPVVPEKPYVYPPLRLLNRPQGASGGVSNTELKETAAKLHSTLRSFGVNVTVTNISCGPTVTRYELQPEQGVKVSKITALADDIKLNLAAADIRIEAPIPGKAAVGIEVPNSENSMVYLRTLLETSDFRDSKAKIAFAVGKDIGGSSIVADLTKMPHLLIAGQTGSGKSVCVNTLIMSILFKYSPKQVRLIMVDPKVVELSVYNGIPHLWAPVVTDPKIASATLNWAVKEMGDRYQLFAHLGVRNMEGFNEKIKNSTEPVLDKEGNPLKEMPHLVIIVDELADLMMVAKGDVEDAICRLAQLARAAGIHLVIATQRPSVNVITGLIKANVPSRIAFAVSSSIDSRTILDQIGAEKLLGKGDMLFAPSGAPMPSRIQGAFVSDSEVSAVVDFLKKQNDVAEINTNLANHMTGGGSSAGGDAVASDRDEYFEEAGRLIIEKDKASIGMLQRMYKIGFNRAARIMDQLAEAGVVGPEEGTKPRKILMSIDEFDEYMSL